MKPSREHGFAAKPLNNINNKFSNIRLCMQYQRFQLLYHTLPKHYFNRLKYMTTRKYTNLQRFYMEWNNVDCTKCKDSFLTPWIPDASYESNDSDIADNSYDFKNMRIQVMNYNKVYRKADSWSLE